MIAPSSSRRRWGEKNDVDKKLGFGVLPGFSGPRMHQNENCVKEHLRQQPGTAWDCLGCLVELLPR